MLPDFEGPVRWCVGPLAEEGDLLRLLMLEQAEFEAVLRQPVIFDVARADHPGPEVWSVVLDPSAPHAALEASGAGRRIVMTIPKSEDAIDGINLLHTLAYSPEPVVVDSEVETYAAAFDRIRDEITHIFPSQHLRRLDWNAITSSYGYVRDLNGEEFWEHAQRWVAELGDAHTQLHRDGSAFHPPYLAVMDAGGATLLDVPENSDAWDAGVREGDRLQVDQPRAWLSRVGASPQHQQMIAARRFLAMASTSREFTAMSSMGRRIAWTETRRDRPGLVAAGNNLTIRTIASDLPTELHRALDGADPAQPLTLDLRGNVGGDLLAALNASRLLIRDDQPFGSIAFTTGRGTLADAAGLARTPHPDAWSGRIHVLVDPMTYSAAEDLIHPLVGAPHVTIIGGPTGGGSGRPHTRRLKDDFRLATSTAITYTRDGSPIECQGIQPTA